MEGKDSIEMIKEMKYPHPMIARLELADAVRRGEVIKKPCYERWKMIFVAQKKR